MLLVSTGSMLWVLGASFLSLLWLRWWSHKQRRPLPPGPRGLPVIGNTHQLPKANPWERYKEWSDIHGPIMTLSLGINTTIIISSHKVANDLLERKSTSSRPQLILLNRFSAGLNSAGMPYGNLWRDHHSMQVILLRPWMTQRYTALRDVETTQMLVDLLDTNDFDNCFKRMIASLFMTPAYNRRIHRADDPYILGVEDLVRVKGEVAESVFGGASQIVELIPALQRLPTFLTPWNDPCDRVRGRFDRVFLDGLREGLSAPTWTWAKEVWQHKAAQDKTELEIAYTLGTLYEGSLSAQHVLRTIVLASALHPERAVKAQRELDEVVGVDRLPTDADMRDLPYITAFVKETVRWRPLAPLGAPRENTTDMEYNGYFIPKGTSILLNHWALDYDGQMYPDPFTFWPERWIENPNLQLTTFGFGQRGCPGRYFALDSLYNAASKLLWAFDIKVPSTVNAETMLWNQAANAFMNPPPDFEASFTVRDAHREELINREWAKCPKESSEILKEMERTIRSARDA